MNARLTPGVYTNEISGGIRPIEGVGTSTTGFIGEAARGIPNRTTFITSFGAYERAFGGHMRGEAGYLPHAVASYFEAGGTRCVVVRVLPASATGGVSQPLVARGVDPWGIERDVLRLRAMGEGTWSNNLRLNIIESNAFPSVTFGLRVEWIEAGRSRTVETFDALRMDPNHEDYAVRAINERSRYLEADDLLQLELDAAVATLPPLPETVAQLQLNAPDGTYDVEEGATLDFRWTDQMSGITRSGQMVFPDSDPSLSADDMTRLLVPALGPDFRVIGTIRAASVASATGPFDISGTNQITLTIDGAAEVITLAAPSAAQINLGAEPFAGTTAGFVLNMTIDGVPQSYTLQAGDLAGATSTRDELRIAINAAFVGATATLAGGNLLVTSDSIGAGSALALTGPGAAAFGDPAAETGQDGVVDDTAATAEEIARAINDALGGTPYAATVARGAIILTQTDMAGHLMTVTATTAPDAVFVAAATANGPVATGNTDVAIEPNVASRAYRSIHLLDGATQFDAAGVARTVTVRVTVGAVQTEIQVQMAADASLSPAELAAAMEVAAGVENLPGFAVEATAEHVTVSAGPTPAGTAVEVLVNGAAMWRDEVGIAGNGGAIIEDHGAVEIFVSETFQPGIRRISSIIFPAARVAGRDENAVTDPALRPALTDDDPLRLLGGTDGTGPVSANQYAGTTTPTGRRTGLRAFEGGPIAMLALPGKIEGAFTSAAMAWADRNDVFLIVDGPGSLDRTFETSALDVRQYAETMPSRSDNCGFYYPWLRVRDPLGLGRSPTRFMPPSGHIAGIHARTDANRGVWKAAAGVEAQVSGAVGLQHQMIDADQDLLNPVGVNCIRQLPGAGTIVWGARTLSTDPAWRYTSVRRMALFLKRSVRPGLQWAVFEPNDFELWEQIRGSLETFMLALFQRGAFQGTTPAEAFRVKCDRETNPQVQIDQGMVRAELGFAALKPAEFVVVDIMQLAGEA